jgi:hypothetical protein
MKLLSSVTHPLSFTVLFHIFRMASTVAFKVSRILLKPIFEPRIALAIVVRVSLTPLPVVV